MDIIFKTKKLAKIFNEEKRLKKEFGENAKYIKRRMAVLHAALSLIDVPQQKPFKCHELTGNRKGEYAVYLKQPYRLIFKPAHESIPIDNDGGYDLEKITAIKILGVEDYH